MPCLSLNELNSWNFIRWRSATTLPLSSLGSATVCAGTYTGFPNRYNQQDQRLYFPKMVLGSEISTYANLDTPATDADFANWSCVFCDRYGNVNSGHGAITVTKDDLGSGNFRWHISVTPGSANFIVGNIYRFVIYNTSTNNIKYVSNFIQAVAAVDNNTLCLWSYRHSNNIYYFNYEALTSFRNKIYVDLNEKVPAKAEVQFTPYPEVTTGEIRNSKSQTQEIITLESEQFDKEADRAMVALSIHNGILLNTNAVTVKEAYESGEERRSRLNQGIITVYNTAAARINLNGYT